VPPLRPSAQRGSRNASCPLHASPTKDRSDSRWHGDPPGRAGAPGERSPRESQRESAKEHPESHHAMALRPICPARSLDAMKVADVSDRVRQAVLATAGEGMWNAGAVLRRTRSVHPGPNPRDTGATLRNPHANPVAAVVIAPHGPFAPFPAGLPACTNAWKPIVSDAGHAWRPRVEAALRAVPRHMFVPEADPKDTYPTPPWSPNAPAPPSTLRPHRRSWRSCWTCDTRSHVLSELTDGDRLTS
jgi:hypothetical protein